MRTIILDIESVPKGEFIPQEIPEPNYSEIQASSRLKDPIKIKEDIAHKTEKAKKEYEIAISTGMKEQEEQFKARGLNETQNTVVSITCQLNGCEPVNFSSDNEYRNIHNFCEYIMGNVIDENEHWLWIGHFFLKFDIPHLARKMQSYGAFQKTQGNYNNIFDALREMPFFFDDNPYPFLKGKSDHHRKSYIPKHYDLYLHSPGTENKYVDDNGDKKTGKSLDCMLKYSGFTGKVDVDGSDVYDLYNDGRLDLIAQYNISEVQQMYDWFYWNSEWWSSNVWDQVDKQNYFSQVKNIPSWD